MGVASRFLDLADFMRAHIWKVVVGPEGCSWADGLLLWRLLECQGALCQMLFQGAQSLSADVVFSVLLFRGDVGSTMALDVAARLTS